MAEAGRKRAGYNKHFIAAGAFVAFWFGMDLVQFIEWCVQLFRPATVICK